MSSERQTAIKVARAAAGMVRRNTPWGMKGYEEHMRAANKGTVPWSVFPLVRFEGYRTLASF